MKSRLVITDAERARLWDVVAKNHRAAGEIPEAKHAKWVAANIRTPFPTKRPEEM